MFVPGGTTSAKLAYACDYGNTGIGPPWQKSLFVERYPNMYILCRNGAPRLAREGLAMKFWRLGRANNLKLRDQDGVITIDDGASEILWRI